MSRGWTEVSEQEMFEFVDHLAPKTKRPENGIEVEMHEQPDELSCVAGVQIHAFRNTKKVFCRDAKGIVVEK